VIVQLNGAYENVASTQNMPTDDSNLNQEPPMEIELRMSANENTAQASSSIGT
jgi:hypothetical protein